MQSAIRFNSDNLFCKETSIAKPIKNGAPKNIAFLMSDCTKSMSGASGVNVHQNEKPVFLNEMTSVAMMSISHQE